MLIMDRSIFMLIIMKFLMTALEKRERARKNNMSTKTLQSETRKLPKLRFPGFSGDWEEKKLENIAKINPSQENIPNEFVYIDLESVDKGVFKQGQKIQKKDAPSRAQRVLHKKDILFQTV